MFGPDRAEADGWKAPYCGKPDFSPRTSPAIAAFPLRVRHPELASLVSPAAVATKLTARLSGEAFSRDVAIRWDRFRSKGQTLHANGAAWSRSLGWGAWVLAGIACLGGLPGFRGKCPAPWFSPTDRYGAGLAGLVVVLGYLATPRAPAERISTVPRHTIAHMKQVLLAMAVEASDLAEVQAVVRLPFEADRSNGVARLRTTFTEMLRTNQTLRPVPRAGPPSNPFTGLPCRIEASPGNVHLEATPTGLDVVWYDFDGAAAYRYDIPRSDLPPDSTTDAPRSTIAR
ncbi:MAG: hypothetical protein JNL97_02345 [Verrucomicrobiales bacterium]|nr:hypothetical protein [Verrucomicrobiales bacterium]